MVGRLVGRLVGRSVGWFVGWLPARRVHGLKDGRGHTRVRGGMKLEQRGGNGQNQARVKNTVLELGESELGGPDEVVLRQPVLVL